jgi:hypothetical protein
MDVTEVEYLFKSYGDANALQRDRRLIGRGGRPRLQSRECAFRVF